MYKVFRTMYLAAFYDIQLLKYPSEIIPSDASCGQEVSISISSRAINQVVNRETGAGNKNKCSQLRWRLSYCQTLLFISDVREPRRWARCSAPAAEDDPLKSLISWCFNFYRAALPLHKENESHPSLAIFEGLSFKLIGEAQRKFCFTLIAVQQHTLNQTDRQKTAVENSDYTPRFSFSGEKTLTSECIPIP